MSRHHVLLLGGHGKVSQHLTPLLLQRSWNVTSIIRNQDQVSTIKQLGEDKGGQLNVLVRSLEDVKTEGEAKSLLDEVKPDYVVFSAGAGGKGAPERTFQIDRDAATHFIRASAATPSVTKFLLISYLASRRAKPSWWDDEAWDVAQQVNRTLASYYAAKIVADEALYEASRGRSDFVALGLRPGTLTEDAAGKVELGKTKHAKGNVGRESVARVADELLANDDVKSSWLDLLDGDEEIGSAVARVARDGVDSSEEEPIRKAEDTNR